MIQDKPPKTTQSGIFSGDYEKIKDAARNRSLGFSDFDSFTVVEPSDDSRTIVKQSPNLTQFSCSDLETLMCYECH